MDNFIDVIRRLLGFLCVVLSSLLVLCVLWQVFSRYILSSPSTATDELARFLFMWVGLMGAVYTLGEKRHLAINLLDQLTEHQLVGRTLLRVLVAALSLVFASIVMIYGGGRLMLQTLSSGQISPALGFQMGYIYSVIPMSGILMIPYLFADLLSHFKSLPQINQVNQGGPS